MSRCVRVIDLIYSLTRFSVQAPIHGTLAPAETFFIDQNLIENARRRFLAARQTAAPSSAGIAAVFERSQQGQTMIPFGRPEDPGCRPPIWLFHETLAKFMDDASRCQIDQKVLLLAREFKTEMCKFYKAEKLCEAAICALFGRYGIDLQKITIQGESYTTDGAACANGFYAALLEFKNEQNSGNAECLMQAIMYYLESLRKRAPKYSHSPLPCLLVLVFGELVLCY